MGVMNASLPELVKRSYEIGIRHFDTAAVYQRGRNEEMVGSVIKQLGVRDKVVIATKVFLPPPQRALDAESLKSAILKSAEESLQRLQTSYVDIFYFHNVEKISDLSLPGLREAMRQLKQQGKIRHIGFSTHQNMKALLEAAAAEKEDFWEVILTTCNFTLSEDAGFLKALEAAFKRGIGLVAMKTQSAPDWYLRNLPERMQQMYKGGVNNSAVLKWALSLPFITTAVPGYTTFQHMEENFALAKNLTFTPEEKKFLTDREVKLAVGYCRQCTECVGQCPASVDVPSLMRVHLYATSYRNFEHARMTLDEVAAGRSLERCTLCPTCRVGCRNGVDVPGRLAELQTLYA
jgi:predicted aldo/keto reductase-like oxidoreductase